jgi:hypothetical protein
MLAAEVGRANGRGIGANVGVKDSRRGTRGQLVGGTVEVQVAPAWMDPARNIGKRPFSTRLAVCPDCLIVSFSPTSKQSEPLVF